MSFLVVAILGAASVRADEVGALIDALVENKLLTPEQAEHVRSGIAKENAKSAAAKIKLSDSITELRLWGELRLRYQYDQTDAQVPRPSVVSAAGASPNDALLGALPNVNQRSRERFHLRLGADIKVGEHLFGGFALASGQTADSNMETFTSGFDNYNIYISRVYLGWKPTDWTTFVFGKEENPYYTTDLRWDPDINPQGIFETFDLSKRFFPDRPLSLSLVAGQLIFFDNDEFRRPHASGTDAWLFSEQLKGTYKFNPDVSLTLAPGFDAYNAVRLSGLRNARAFSDANFPNFDRPVQAQIVTTTSSQTSLSYDAKGVPTLTTTPLNVQTATTITDPSTGNKREVTASSSARQTQLREPGDKVAGLVKYGIPVNPRLANHTFVSTKSSGSGKVDITSPQPRPNRETADLEIVTAPGDFQFKLGHQKIKLYWDLGYNLRGRERFDNELGLDDPVIIATQDALNPVIVTTRRVFGQHFHERDALAWLAGLQLGENKKRGDWAFIANYRETGIASIDPNLNDSDFALSFVNTRGFKLSLIYSFADRMTLGAAFSHAWNLEPDLIGGQATTGAAIGDASSIDVFQIDMNWKF